MAKIIIICVCLLLLIVFFSLKKGDYKTFNKYYYTYVYNFNEDQFKSLDDDGKYEYCELLKAILTVVEPTKEKNTTINEQILKTKELISYIEKNYGDFE